MFPSSLLLKAPVPFIQPRDVKSVPFVELYEGRLQGVVSSGSDVKRVYIAYFQARSLNYYCSTNNNRPCGGLGGRPCTHLQKLLAAAVHQYGMPALLKYLQFPGDPTQVSKVGDILKAAGQSSGQAYSEIFSRFLGYLQLLELPGSNQPLPEMDWFLGDS